MTDFDPYSQKIADVCALIRQHGKCEAWELFKNSERGLEVLCAIVDAVREEAKAAVPVLPTDWLIDGSLVYRLNEYEVNCDEINITMAGGSRQEAPRRQRAEAILAMFSAPIAVAEQTKQQEPK
jgi:hypothetical protein